MFSYVCSSPLFASWWRSEGTFFFFFIFFFLVFIDLLYFCIFFHKNEIHRSVLYYIWCVRITACAGVTQKIVSSCGASRKTGSTRLLQRSGRHSNVIPPKDLYWKNPLSTKNVFIFPREEESPCTTTSRTEPTIRHSVFYHFFNEKVNLFDFMHVFNSACTSLHPGAGRF